MQIYMFLQKKTSDSASFLLSFDAKLFIIRYLCLNILIPHSMNEAIFNRRNELLRVPLTRAFFYEAYGN